MPDAGHSTLKFMRQFVVLRVASARYCSRFCIAIGRNLLVFRGSQFAFALIAGETPAPFGIFTKQTLSEPERE